MYSVLIWDDIKISKTFHLFPYKIHREIQKIFKKVMLQWWYWNILILSKSYGDLKGGNLALCEARKAFQQVQVSPWKMESCRSLFLLSFWLFDSVFSFSVSFSTHTCTHTLKQNPNISQLWSNYRVRRCLDLKLALWEVETELWVGRGWDLEKFAK